MRGWAEVLTTKSDVDVRVDWVMIYEMNIDIHEDR